MKNHFKTLFKTFEFCFVYIALIGALLVGFALGVGVKHETIDEKQKQYGGVSDVIMPLKGEVKFAPDGTATVTFKGLDYTDCEWAISAAKRPHCNIGELPITMNYEMKFHVDGSPGELKMKIINKQKGKVLL